MKLDVNQKDKLLQNAKSVYKSYLALDLFKNFEFLGAEKFKFFDVCQSMIKAGEKSKEFTIDGNKFELAIEGTSPSYKLKFTAINPKNFLSSKLQPLAGYSSSQVLSLLSEQQFQIEDTGGKYFLSNSINENVSVGGPGKIDLYRTHLTTLLAIIEKIESEEDVSNLLVALATGSGKTYVQALWMLILNLSNLHAVIAMPDNLREQFIGQLQKLLPTDWLADNLKSIVQGPKKPEDVDLISSLNKEETKPTLILASAEQLLDDYYQPLMKLNPQKTFFCFDEQHLLMRVQTRRKLRFTKLSKTFLSMLLSATPNEETYKLAGSKPVASMSIGQKRKHGQGQFPELMTVEAKSISDTIKPLTFKLGRKEFNRRLFQKIFIGFKNRFIEDYPAVGVTVTEDLPFLVHHKPNEPNLRWSVQVPMARKALIITDNNETVVNFNSAIEKDRHRSHGRTHVYKNGAIIDRGNDPLESKLATEHYETRVEAWFWQ